MGRLRTLSGADACRILQANGFRHVRQRGSHAIMQKAVPGSTITVPVPMHSELRTGTLLSIIRQSGLPRALFEEWPASGGPAVYAEAEGVNWNGRHSRPG